MSTPSSKTGSNRPKANDDIEKDWVTTSSTPPLYPVSLTYATAQPGTSPTTHAQFVYPQAAPQSPFTYSSLPQYASGSSSPYKSANGAPMTPIGPSTLVAPTVTTYITDHSQASSLAASHAAGQHKPVPPSYGIATSYSSYPANLPYQVAPPAYPKLDSAPSNQAQQAHSTHMGSSYEARPATVNASQLYPGNVFLRSSNPPPELSGRQQYLHKASDATPYLYYNPYVTTNPYPSHPLWVPPTTSQAQRTQPSSTPLMSPHPVSYPTFGNDPRVQVGASHLAASKAQDDYMRQIKALQSFYGYSSNQSSEADYAMPAHSYRANRGAQAPEHQGEKRATLTASVDVLLSSASKDSFIEKQERILRECNAKKVPVESAKSPLNDPTASGVLIDDEELFDSLLRSENPQAAVSYPVLVVPEPVEALDEKLSTRIADAQAFSRRARGYAHLDNTLWNLSYVLRHHGSGGLLSVGKAPKPEPVRKSYLISSRGRREPLEESVGRDWQLMDDGPPVQTRGGQAPGMGTNLEALYAASQGSSSAMSGTPGFMQDGRFLYPTKMVTFDNPLAYSIKPAQVAKDSEIERCIYKDVVELKDVQSFCLGYGIPKRSRAVVWQLMLGYIPTRASERGKALRESRIRYYDYFDKYLSDKVPLTKQDRTMYNLVLVDAPRTHPDGYHALFSKPSVQASLERVLYLWARNHPETSYYQGLNDLASIIMVVFLECCLPDLADVGKAGQEDLMEHLGLPTFESSFLASPEFSEALESALYCVEADTYHCLTLILGRVADFHLFSAGGVYSESMVVHLEEIVKRADPELHSHLAGNDLMFIQFSFRWMLCFFTRELETRNLVCLWDSYVIEPVGFPVYHIYVCAAYLIELRKLLLGQDMISMMGLLQHAPTGHFTKHDVHRLTQNAADLSTRFPLNIRPLKHSVDTQQQRQNSSR